jgi:multidrug resistance efflux pump
MGRKSLKVLLAGMALLAIMGPVLFWPQAPLDSAPTSPEPPRARLVCYGYIDCQQGQIFLQSGRVGRVTRVLVKEGQAVSKGSLLLQMDDQQVKLQEEEAALSVQGAKLQLAKAKDGVKQFSARRAEAEAALAAARSKVEAAQCTLARKEELVKLDVVNHAEVDVSRAQLDEAKALVSAEQNRLWELDAVNPETEVRLAQVQLDRSHAEIERPTEERRQYQLRSPVDGVVLRMDAQEGDLLAPTSPRAALWLAPKGERIVRAEVPQEFAAQVRAGLPAQVEDEASGTLLARGNIRTVSDWILPRRQFGASPTSVNTGQTLECVISLQDQHGRLRLGQRVRVRVLAESPADSPHALSDRAPQGSSFGEASPDARTGVRCPQVPRSDAFPSFIPNPRSAR